MAEFTLNVEDVDRYAHQLAHAANVVDDYWADLKEEFAHKIVAQAQANASGRPGPRVRTGRLRSSIQVDHDGNPSADAPYAGFVEFGTSRMAPRPFMRPAVNKYRPEFRRAMIDVAADLGLPRSAGRRATTTRRAKGDPIPVFGVAEQIRGGQYTP